MDKKISVATVAKRMNRILAAYREQCQETDGEAAVASTSSSSASIGETNFTSQRKMELDKMILNYAVQKENESDSDVSVHNYTFASDSPLKRRYQSSSYKKTVDQQLQPKRRRQPSRTVKRAAMKLTSLASKRVQRKVTCTVTSNASPDRSSHESSDDSSDSPMPLVFPDSDDDDDNVSDAITTPVNPVKSSFIIKTTSKTTCVQPM